MSVMRGGCGGVWLRPIGVIVTWNGRDGVDREAEFPDEAKANQYAALL